MIFWNSIFAQKNGWEVMKSRSETINCLRSGSLETTSDEALHTRILLGRVLETVSVRQSGLQDWAESKAGLGRKSHWGFSLSFRIIPNWGKGVGVHWMDLWVAPDWEPNHGQGSSLSWRHLQRGKQLQKSAAHPPGSCGNDSIHLQGGSGWLTLEFTVII